MHSLGDVFGEPAWDMMLDLFIADRTGTRISVSSLCIGSNAPPTTALRYIRTMVERGVFTRMPDPSDNRRIWVSLSNWAVDEIEQILA
jgi:DNA-binding MarR family transcriptional regulator